MKPLDISKFRKSITKSISGLSVGFKDPDTWVSTGNYALNYMISGSFYKGIPLGKVTMFAGESGCVPESATVKVKINNELELITVDRLKTLFTDKTPFEILTPDGWQTISRWYNKGLMKTVTVTVESGLKHTCAVSHLLQRSNNTWIRADEVRVGDKLLTENGFDKVILVTHGSTQECYDFTIEHLNHRYWCDGFSSHNSGKSYICSGNIVKHAQEQGIYVILIDTENALDETWLKALGVDTSEEKMLKLSMAMIDDAAKTINDFMKEYREMDDPPKVLFVIDSLGMMLTPTDTDQFQKGDLKGDLGRKAKAMGALVRNCVNMFGSYNVGLVVTNHTTANMNPYDLDPTIPGGQVIIFASSIVVAIQKLKLKEDQDGNKVTDVRGIRANCKVLKTRYSKPFEKIEVRIPWDTGMDPYSGLFDLFEKRKVLCREGNRYTYTMPNGDILKYYRKEWLKNIDNAFDKIMKDVMDNKTLLAQQDEEVEEESGEDE